MALFLKSTLLLIDVCTIGPRVTVVIILSLASIIVGVQYHNEGDCNIAGVINYLLTAGSLGFVFTGLQKSSVSYVTYIYIF